MASETITRNDLTAILSEVFQPVGNIRQIKTDVAVPAISGGGYTTVAVPSPSLDVGEVVIGNRLIETDAALQVTLRYSNGWWLNASNEYSGTASAHNVEVWWVVLKNGAVTGVNDYIVEQDTSGIWTYRKWNSGIAECWCRDSATETGSGGEYVFNLTYPLAFTELPMINIGGRVGSNYSHVNYIAGETVSGCYGYIKDESGSSASNTVVIWADIKGRWE